MITTSKNMVIDWEKNCTLDSVKHPILAAAQVQLSVVRLDKLHPIVSGNKWFKLKKNIAQAQTLKHKRILTFGGAFSNHLVATAAACQLLNLPAIAVVRGLHGAAQTTPTLEACKLMGMQLHFVNRENYNRKNDADFLQELKHQYDNPYIIAEGGYNELGVQGAAEIAQFIPQESNFVCSAIGSGITFAGLINAMPKTTALLGFTAFKHGHYLQKDIEHFTKNKYNNWHLQTDYHFGGFAKHNKELIHFMNHFYETTSIPLDFVYTAKMMYGIFDLIKKNRFARGSTITAVHTGGLQGNASIATQLLY